MNIKSTQQATSSQAMSKACSRRKEPLPSRLDAQASYRDSLDEFTLQEEKVACFLTITGFFSGVTSGILGGASCIGVFVAASRAGVDPAVASVAASTVGVVVGCAIHSFYQSFANSMSERHLQPKLDEATKNVQDHRNAYRDSLHLELNDGCLLADLTPSWNAHIESEKKNDPESSSFLSERVSLLYTLADQRLSNNHTSSRKRP